jgi:CrcB protein
MSEVGTWSRIALLSVGGSLGVNARYWLGIAITRWSGPQFPWATLTINVSGAFAIGFLMAMLTHWLPHPNIRLLLIVGFLGGYTTFSSFAFEALTLWENGERARGVAYVAGSVGAGLVAVVLGTAAGRGLIEYSWRPESPAALAEVAGEPASESDEVHAGPPGDPGSPERAATPEDHP